MELYTASDVSFARSDPERVKLPAGQIPSAALIAELLAASAELHHHVCPRQVLGVRIGLLGLRLLGLPAEGRYFNEQKRLLTFVETDGCGADGVSVATGCWVGRRTLRVVDYGKMAATLVDSKGSVAVRIAPHPDARTAVLPFAPSAPDKWHAYLEGYRVMPDHLLLVAEHVTLRRPIAAIVSRPDARAICDRCGEEIRNEREVLRGEATLCQACAGNSYYQTDH